MSTFSGQIRCKKIASRCKLGKFRNNNNLAWRLSPYRYSTFNRGYFVSMAAADAGITEEQMSAALRAYQTQFDQLVLNGHSIQLEGLGNFRLSCSMKVAGDVQDISMDLFKRLRVILRPSKELSNEIKSVQHIVDAPISANSGDSGKYVLNYQLPLVYPKPGGGIWNLQIWPAPGDRQGIDFNYMSDLFFIINDPELGDVKMQARKVDELLVFENDEAGASIAFTNEDSYAAIDEMILNQGTTIKMFGGK